MRTIVARQMALERHVGPLSRWMQSQLREGAWSGVIAPARSAIVDEEPFSVFAAMPALSRLHRVYVTKVAGYVASSRGVDGVVVVMDSETAEVRAILDAGPATRLKNAAATLLATDACAADDARTLAVIGAGALARAQIHGVLNCREIRRLRVFSRTPSNARDMLSELAPIMPRGCAAEIVNTAEEAVREADIVCTATSSVYPLFADECLSLGVHVNCMGAHSTTGREVEHATLATSALVVEELATAIREAGDVHRGAWSFERLHMDRSLNLKPLRTVFSSTGHAVLDLLTAAYLTKQMD
jgi:ornithine cyclodeaminase/alanine dehydrogenase-like protein (mu-crystallin family)